MSFQLSLSFQLQIALSFSISTAYSHQYQLSKQFSKKFNPSFNPQWMEKMFAFLPMGKLEQERLLLWKVQIAWCYLMITMRFMSSVEYYLVQLISFLRKWKGLKSSSTKSIGLRYLLWKSTVIMWEICTLILILHWIW